MLAPEVSVFSSCNVVNRRKFEQASLSRKKLFVLDMCLLLVTVVQINYRFVFIQVIFVQVTIFFFLGRCPEVAVLNSSV